MNAVNDTQNISNLKSFVRSLEVESHDRQNELKAVVGGKYQDFIKSGHAIEEMAKIATQVTTTASSFDKLNETLYHHSKSILQHDSVTTAQNKTNLIESRKRGKKNDNCVIDALVNL